MSWSAYIDSLETGKGKCKYAAIYGKQGGVWAESTNKSVFPATAEDVANVTRVLVNQDLNIMGTGLTIAKFKFTCLRMEPDILICQGKDNKDHSLVIALSNTAVIIGFNPDADIKTAQVREGVEAMRDYLKSCSY